MPEQATNIFAPLYKQLKEARAAFREHSQGELELLSGVYQGESHRHHVYHVKCNGHSWVSIQDLASLPTGKFCPHCHGTDDLSRFGSIEHLQISVYRVSGEAAYIFASNALGPADQDYTFWCIRHRRSYETTFAEFQRGQGKTNGCPLCEREAMDY